jgi:hypothetical protein
MSQHEGLPSEGLFGGPLTDIRPEGLRHTHVRFGGDRLTEGVSARLARPGLQRMESAELKLQRTTGAGRTGTGALRRA